MSMQNVTHITGRAVYVPGDDVDTDRIIPARFMKCITFDGLGEYLFHDVRFEKDGSRKEHNLNDSRFEGASIMVCGSNFGCGSSREHAPQSLYRAGFRGLVAGNFAEIFFGNSTSLGIPCVSASKEDRDKLIAAVEANPQLDVTIDLVDLKVRFGEDSIPCEIREGARDSLLNGRFDPLDELLDGNEQVNAVAQRLSYG
ncbi:MAG: 3-isopropylmalate dehydratase small subunit [Opitutae bacterium]|nr:3-isopropylmalate dehydratase small subunit [Opitutae bacterium]|tara:strand:+ start:3051 stop:3647 length:597 start_codon:yes stop_codon:yes gene_type:complete